MKSIDINQVKPGFVEFGVHESVQKLGPFDWYRYKERLNRLEDVEPADMEIAVESEF